MRLRSSCSTLRGQWGPRRAAPLVAVALLLGASAGKAEKNAASEPVGELADVRLRYGVSLRDGSQDDLGPGLSYSGLTPNDVQLSAWVFGTGYVGGALGVSREGFSLFEDGTRITGGSLLRAQLGPVARVRLGVVRIELLAAYQYAQLAAFGRTIEPAFTPAQRHAVLLGGRLMLDLGKVTLEARGEYPLALRVDDGAGGKGSAEGWSAGATIAFPVLRSGEWVFGPALDGQFVRDFVTSEDGSTRARQKVIRAGLALQIKWELPRKPPPPPVGDLTVVVADSASGLAVPGARVTLVRTGAPDVPLVLDGKGQGTVLAQPAGPLTARATAPGYLPGQGSAEIVDQQAATVRIALKKEPPKVGSVVITVTDKESGKPLAEAKVVVRDEELLTSAAGEVRLKDLPPGPLGVSVKAKGFRPAQEAASIVAGVESQVSVPLNREEKKPLATITGLVRSTRGGKPIAADLELPQVKLKTRATERGAFTFRVEGGTYTVRISAPGYLGQTKTVTVKDGDQAIFNVDLHPK